MSLFARDRTTGRKNLSEEMNALFPDGGPHWMTFNGLPGRKLMKAQYASLDSAVEAVGGSKKFKERSSLFVNTDAGRENVKDRIKKDPDSVIEQYDPPVLISLSCTEWSFADVTISEENADELPSGVQKWAVRQILEMEGILGPRSDEGND